MGGDDVRDLSAAPIIGVSSSEVRAPEHLKELPEGEPPHREVCLGQPYLNSLMQVGGVPLIVAPLSIAAIDRVLDSIDGLCLSGGPDLDPKTYGQMPHPELGPTELAVDSFELELARRADARGMPILAICRGSQLLNVARGGTLLQHIPELPDSGLQHRQKQLGHYRTHTVEVVPGTLLARTLGEAAVGVNSFHHQAIDRLGDNLRVSAKSEDGIVEAIESVDRDYTLGVQWHAESLTDTADQEALFAGLIDASERYRREIDSTSVRAV